MKSILPVCLTYHTKKWFSVTTELDLSNPIFHEFFTIFRVFYRQLSRAYWCESVRFDSVCDLSLWHQWLDGGSHEPSAPDVMELSGASFFSSARPIWTVLSGSITDGNETNCFNTYRLTRAGWVSIRHLCRGVTICDIFCKARVKNIDRLLQSAVGHFL